MEGAASPHERSHALPLLTGLRGFAALIVFISHAAIVGFLPSQFGHGFGQIGVMLFFVLSGFLMAHIYIWREFTSANIMDYAKARIGRVVPLYLLVIAGSIIIYNLFYSDFRYALDLENVSQILASIFFIAAPYELWTIPVEFQFYLLFPVFWLLRARGASPLTLVVCAIAVSLPTVASVIFFNKKFNFISSYSYAFFLGIFTYLCFGKIKDLILGGLPPWIGGGFLLLVFLNLPEVRMEYGLALSDGGYWVSTWLDPITWFIVYGLFLSCLAESKSLGLLKSRGFQFFGNISYGFYLFHYPILAATSDFIGTGIYGLFIALMASVALSYLSYRIFERPLMGMIRSSSISKSSK